MRLLSYLRDYFYRCGLWGNNMGRKILKFWIAVFAVIIAILLVLTCSMLVEAHENEEQNMHEFIEIVCEDRNICPELVEAIIETESNWNPNAQNGGCIGLMQISEKWHRERMQRLEVTDLTDPYGNILVGVDYLAELFDKYEDVGMVLLVYNGSSMANDYWDTGELSSYAEKILTRSAELERIHGK